jgi:hypothetical protein
VASGVNSLIGHPAAWDKNCRPRPVSVSVTRPPANGKISVVDATVEVDRVRVGTDPGGCAGRSMRGKNVMYRSADSTDQRNTF